MSLRGRALLPVLLILALLLLLYHILSPAHPVHPPPKSPSRLSLSSLPSPLAAHLSLNAFRGHKIVHLDLKGAPPVLAYYHRLLPLLRSLGATGILLEYEDMFPFTSSLQNVSATNAYSTQDILKIQEIATTNGLIVIPLIQTFGHLEFLLKLETHKELREVPRYPQAICPSNPKTLPLIQEMIDQVIRYHPHARYLHIGADEVFHLGECVRCQDELVRHQWTKRQLFLAHIKRVTDYIKKTYPQVRILMWDDEFRGISPEEIIGTGLHKVVEPVVWKYTRNPGDAVDPLWEGYGETWSKIWAATAFKGATEPDRYWTDIGYHMENHRKWMEILERWSDRVRFQGVFLTGWQRYDHFGILCELLASSLPSLAMNLAVLQGRDTGEPSGEVLRVLECEGPVALGPEPNYGWSKCKFPGVEVYNVIVRLYGLHQEIERMEGENTFKGWVREYNIKHEFSNPSYVEQALGELDRFRMEIGFIEREMKTAMEGVYDDFTFKEWVETLLVPLKEKIDRLWVGREAILSRESWPRRPLKEEL